MAKDTKRGSNASGKNSKPGSRPPHDPLAEDFQKQDANGGYAEKDGRLFAPDGRPVVRWKLGELPAIVDQAELCLSGSNEQIFQRYPFLVRVTRRSVPTIRNYKRAAGALGLVMIEAPYLIEALTRCATWEKYDSRGETWRSINAPEQVATTYLARCGHWRLPQLWGAISAPTLRPDGTVLQKPGYDEEMQLYYDPCGIEFPRIPDDPDMNDANAAFQVLREAFASFPYADEVDRAVALSFMLTALVRRSLPSAPLGAISAPVMGSGKTLLADCVSILATGAIAPSMTFAETDEEAKKTALAVLMEGDPVVLIDNVERPLAGDWLCSILTSEVYKQRMLGRTEMVSVPTRILFLATGNHITVAGDLRTRTLLCRVDPKLEHPEQRAFSYDLREKIAHDRPRIVAAGLTLMRAFIATGQLEMDFAKPWGRFEHWSRMVRCPLMWMDCEDPCRSLTTLQDEDPVRNEHLRLSAAWFGSFGDKALTARAAIETLNQPSPTDSELQLKRVFEEVALDKAGGVISAKRVGKWMDKHKGARVGGYQIEAAGHDANHTMEWRVRRLDAK